MLFRLPIIITSIVCLCGIKSYGQMNENEILEKSKGTWHVPIEDFKEVRTIESRKRAYTWDRNDSSISIICDSPYYVHAVYHGTVAFINQDGKQYYLVTNFGDYYISYGPLSKPDFKTGDLVKAGQIIARLNKDKNEMEYQLDLSVMKNQRSTDAFKWFKW
jgi:hypothetical protein